MVGVPYEITGLKRTISFFNDLAKTQVELNKLTRKQADSGKDFARDIAPAWTGALIQGIQRRDEKRDTYSIVSRTPDRNNPRRVPYHYYLSKGARGRAGQGARKSGDHQYMDTTYDYLKKRYPELVERALDRKLKKK